MVVWGLSVMANVEELTEVTGQCRKVGRGMVATPDIAQQGGTAESPLPDLG